MSVFRSELHWKPIVAFLAGAILLGGVSGCGDRSGKSSSTTTAEADGDSGDASDVSARPVAAIDEQSIGQTVVLEGTVTRQCPSVGCWFMVKGDFGEVFVDLNPSGKRLKEKREGQRARVVGRVVKNGGQLQVEAQQIAFSSDDPSRGADKSASEATEK